MNRTYKAEGIVLKRRNFSEADRLITLFTKKSGKQIVLAKGIRRFKSRKSPHLELFNLVNLTLAKGRNFDIVTEAETIASHRTLVNNMKNLAYGYRILELVDSLSAENQPNEYIFNLLIITLYKLDTKNDDPKSVMEHFAREILHQAGFLSPDKQLSGDDLEQYLEQILERQLKSDSLLTRLKD